MSRDLNPIDPEWAWRPFTPTAERPWNRAAAAHLHRRAGFAASSATLDAAVANSPGEVVRALLEAPPEAEDFRRQIDDLSASVLAGGDPRGLAAAWVYRLLGTPHPLREKMTLFWHGHFATSAEKVEKADLMHGQNEMLRRHALGDFGRLVQEISRDPAMLVYLDSTTNRKSHPNENYAREVMELFCLGEGHYTENDVQQLARCFTGWEVRRGKFYFNRYQHDTGAKSILGESGEFGGQEAVEIILRQDEAPRFIVGKLFRFFICDEPQPPRALLEPLVETFRASRLDIAVLVERILGSELFFSEYAVGRKVRSPVELAVGLLRALEGSTNAYDLARGLQELGQGLFYPPNVKGWDGGRAWINSSTLLARTNLVERLLGDEKTRFGGDSLVELLKDHDVRGPGQQVQWLAELLLAAPLSMAVKERLVELAGGSGDPERQVRNVVYALASTPEFQLN
ncbi:MAG: DUF1800 domain-containing protein [Pirellulaceae bacterium]